MEQILIEILLFKIKNFEYLANFIFKIKIKLLYQFKSD